MMNQEIKADWVAALRSGRFNQGMRVLRRGDHYCCLGVLCELAIEAGENVERVLDSDRTEACYTYDGEASVLPNSVIEWAELRGENPSLPDFPDRYYEKLDDDYEVAVVTLAYINDHGMSFSDIADIIELNTEL